MSDYFTRITKDEIEMSELVKKGIELSRESRPVVLHCEYRELRRKGELFKRKTEEEVYKPFDKVYIEFKRLKKMVNEINRLLLEINKENTTIFSQKLSEVVDDQDITSGKYYNFLENQNEKKMKHYIDFENMLKDLDDRSNYIDEFKTYTEKIISEKKIIESIQSSINKLSEVLNISDIDKAYEKYREVLKTNKETAKDITKYLGEVKNRFKKTERKLLNYNNKIDKEFEKGEKVIKSIEELKTFGEIRDYVKTKSRDYYIKDKIIGVHKKLQKLKKKIKKK